MLRACIVTGEYPPDEGGVADYTRQLAGALAAERVAVDIVTSRRPGWRSLPPKDDGLPPDVRRWVNVHRVVPSWGWSSLRSLRRAVGVLGPDIVHVQYQAAAFALKAPIHLAPWAVGRGGSVRTAVTFHDLRVPYLFPRAGGLRRRAVFGLGGLADLAVATNAADHAALTAVLPADHVVLVPIGSNVPDAPPPEFDRATFRENAGVGSDVGLIAYFGFLNESKGGGTLVEALGALAATGRDVQLVMVGGAIGASDPTNARTLGTFETRVEALGLAGRVRWTGHLPPAGVSAWLRAADVSALPYRDGASYRRGSLLAALTHGLPVVTTRPPLDPPPVPGAPPPLVDGRSALLVPPDDPDALAAAVARVLDDPAAASRLSAGARELARAFDWEAIAARHIELYRAMLGADGA